MKKDKIKKRNLPDLHILGDLQDVKNLVSTLNKKKTIGVFKDAEEGSFHLEINGKVQQILKDDITELEKDYRLIFFSFFPSRKKVEPLAEEQPDIQEPEKEEKQDKDMKKEKKEKKSNKGKKKSSKK